MAGSRAGVRGARITPLRRAMVEIAEHIAKVAESVDEDEVEKMIRILLEARSSGRRVMVVGAGRSGLVGKAFAMRLMHLGFDVYVVGETITPSLRKGDVLIAISGSGRTHVVVSVADAARKMGGRVIAVTSFRDSPLARISHLVVIVPGRTKVAKEEDYFARQILGMYEPLAPLGTLFEDSAMVFLDGVVVELMERLGITEDYMRERHANLESV